MSSRSPRVKARKWMACAISWTVSTILFEQTTRRAGTFVVNLVKVTLALVFLSVLLWIVNGQAFPPTVPARALPWLVLSGLIGFVVGDLFLFQAFATVGARISMLVYTLSPAMTAAGSAVLLGEHLGRLGMAGIITTLAGVMLVALRRKGGEIRDSSAHFSHSSEHSVRRRAISSARRRCFSVILWKPPMSGLQAGCGP